MVTPYYPQAKESDMTDKTVTMHYNGKQCTFEDPEVVEAMRNLVECIKGTTSTTTTPPMTEPTHPFAVVMDDETSPYPIERRSSGPKDTVPWRVMNEHGNTLSYLGWSDLRNPRPLTPAEYHQHGIPQPLPDGHVAVPVEAFGPRTPGGIRDAAREVNSNGRPNTANLLFACAAALEKHLADQDG